VKIEVRNLKVSLSEETIAYTAIIHIDGKPAFDARNQGHGGCDLIRPLGNGPSEQEVNAYLAENVAPDGPFEDDPAKRQPYDIGRPCNLESFIGREIARLSEEKEWARVTKKIAILVGDQVRTYPPKSLPPTEANLARIREQIKEGKIKGLLINGADEEVTLRAKRAFGLRPVDNDEAVLERLREGRLTAADCRYLLAKEKRSEKVTDDLVVELEEIAEQQEAAAKAFAEERDSKLKAYDEYRDAPLPERFVASDIDEPRFSKVIRDSETGREVKLGLCDYHGARLALAHLFA
jgi:hypothetical protein